MGGTGIGGGAECEVGRGEARLDEGEASRSREAAALLVLLKQLLQSLHVQRVIVVHLLLGGLRALGHRDGAAHCRDRGTQVGGGASDAYAGLIGPLP